MFYKATSANPDTSNCDTPKVEHMPHTLYEATSARPDTNNWDVSNVTNTTKMFEGSAYIGKPL